MTPNSYQCLELNAHGLILFIEDCRRNNTPEQCVISNLSSQPCEHLFRELRSMGTTNQTVVNFSIRELTDKLKRIHMKTCIINKHKDKISFPTMTRYKDKPQTLQSLPSNEEIIRAVEKAHCTARDELTHVGLLNADFTDAVSYKLDPPMEIEFVDCYDDPCMGEDCLYSQTELPKELEFIAVNNTETDDSYGSDDEEAREEPIYDAAQLFPNCSESLNLKSSTVGNRYSFKIRDLNGQIKTIKKATLLWMMAPGRFRLSNDRLRRFVQREFI